MTNYIKSKIQQAISFPLVVVIGATTLCGSLLLNANPSYADNPADTKRALNGDKELSGANLSGANLSKADLNETNLSGANLSGANLNETNLNEANLSGANLNRADLSTMPVNEI